MTVSQLPRRLLIAAVAVGAILLVLVSTGPRPSAEHAGTLRRLGGPCLELERWDLFGWNVVGQTFTVDDTSWHQAIENPPCVELADRQILVRLPPGTPEDTYRLCGLADDRACIEFRKVPFEGTPGP